MDTPRVGVDEAGKGPVLGPMVAAAVRGPDHAIPEAVDDSKRLTPERREELDGALRRHEAVSVGVGVVSVDRIDDPETDMNTLTVEAQATAVAAVADDGDSVLADAGDVDEDRFGRRLTELVASSGRTVDVVSEHRADERHPHVAAASVVAKVERDRRVASLAAEFGDVGSGYPSDPTTRAFLREYVGTHGTLPDCARTSWKTCADVLAAAEQSALSEF